jgi:hypothetical protein
MDRIVFTSGDGMVLRKDRSIRKAKFLESENKQTLRRHHGRESKNCLIGRKKRNIGCEGLYPGQTGKIANRVPLEMKHPFGNRKPISVARIIDDCESKRPLANPV